MLGGARWSAMLGGAKGTRTHVWVDSTLGVTPDSISILYEIQNRAKIGGSEKKLRIIF